MAATAHPAHHRNFWGVALVVAVALAGWALRWFDRFESRATYDSLQYMRVAYQHAGYPRPQAYRLAQSVRCRYFLAVRRSPFWYHPLVPRPPAALLHLCHKRSFLPAPNSRYAAIFDARPGYPVAVARLIPVLGSRAFAAVSAVCAVLAGMATAWAGVVLGLGWRGALTAECAVFALPSGVWLTRLDPEGMASLGLALALAGAAYAVRGRRWPIGAAVAGVALLFVFVVKSANAVMGAAMLAAFAGVGLLLAPGARRRLVALAATGIGVVAVSMAANALASWPGLSYTFQDTLTKHFRMPADPHPLTGIVRRDARVLHEHLLVAHTGTVMTVVVVLLAAAALVVRLGWLGLAVVSQGVGGLALVVLHPVGSEISRLAQPTWLATAIGIGATVPLVRRQLEPAFSRWWTARTAPRPARA